MTEPSADAWALGPVSISGHATLFLATGISNLDLAMASMLVTGDDYNAAAGRYRGTWMTVTELLEALEEEDDEESRRTPHGAAGSPSHAA